MRAYRNAPRRQSLRNEEEERDWLPQDASIAR